MLTPTMTQTETMTYKCEGGTFDEPRPGDEIMPPVDPPKFREDISLIN
ncbi:MAG: hypothetical protein ACJ76J_00690 [Thermoanaerobaculia bacterium]